MKHKWAKPEGWQPALKGRGQGAAWIKSHLNYEGDDCIPWPFRTDDKGYGQCSHLGKMYKASRLMCIMLHGDPPTPKHEARHSCGNGHLACMNRQHLAWGTRTENQQDKVAHGRAGRQNESRFKLRPEEVEEIRRRSYSETQVVLANEFGVSPATISKIKDGTRWNSHKRNIRVFSKEEVERIKTLRGVRTQLSLAEEYGVGHTVIWRIQHGKSYTNVRFL